MILYAPIIDPRVPAFVFTSNLSEEDKKITIQTAAIKINFTHNRAVGFNIQQFQLLIWQYNDKRKNIKILTTEVKSSDLDKGEVIFTYTDTDSFLKPNMYYKVQLAYVDNDNSVGPYSTIGVTKCVGNSAHVEAYVESCSRSLLDNQPNANTVTYNGVYYNLDAKNEYVSKYRFTLYHAAENCLIQDSGWSLPNQDGTMPFVVKSDLKTQTTYKLEFQLETINGLLVTKTYKIINTVRRPILYNGGIVASQDAEAVNNGYVLVQLNGLTSYSQGYFRIMRKCDTLQDNIWEEIARTTVQQKPDLASIYYWKDFSVEHGYTYTYAIEQYSDTIPEEYSERIESNSITVQFDDMFLSDGQVQLKIMFNPQVSSFKETILEQKVDTMGSKYPFFFRNGNVQYKEFSVSGLISYLMDDNCCFTLSDIEMQLNTEEAGRQSSERVFSKTTDLSHDNFRTERQFKLKVLEWLNNGQPKVFRSPAEGNYIIRLTNTSLSPNSTVGRMLHTFQSSACEIAEYTYQNLQELNLLKNDSHCPVIALQNDAFTNEVRYGGKYITLTLTSKSGGKKLLSLIEPYQKSLIRFIEISNIQTNGVLGTNVYIKYAKRDSEHDYDFAQANNNKLDSYQIDNVYSAIEVEAQDGYDITIQCKVFIVLNELEWQSLANIRPGDLNLDGDINVRDLYILKKAFQGELIPLDYHWIDLGEDGADQFTEDDIKALEDILHEKEQPPSPLGCGWKSGRWYLPQSKIIKLPTDENVGYYFSSYAAYDKFHNIVTVEYNVTAATGIEYAEELDFNNNSADIDYVEVVIYPTDNSINGDNPPRIELIKQDSQKEVN